jgi:hypothetical protein
LLTLVLAGTSALVVILFILLVGLITQRGLWPQLIGRAIAESPAPTSVAILIPRAAPTPEDSAALRQARPKPLMLGEIGTSSNWRFVVENATLLPDDTANGWSRGVVTFTLQNAKDRASTLDIPSTADSDSPSAHSNQTVPSYAPLPGLPATAPAIASGLRLFLVDQDQRQYGGGFGASGAEYDVMAGPGDVIRLTYTFRYPSGSRGPFLLRLMFPATADSGEFDVRLDRSATTAATLTASHAAPAAMGTWLTVGDEWRVAFEGVEFGPNRGPGERPVTVHLEVENLMPSPEPALTDSADSSGNMRDFYLTDSVGNLAYSHSDSQPGVIVPPHETRRIMVQLFTLALSSTTRPLTFTAVLNWQTNRFLRFQVD